MVEESCPFWLLGPQQYHHWNLGSLSISHLFSGLHLQPSWQLESPPGPLLSESGGMVLYLLSGHYPFVSLSIYAAATHK